jgi:class 3 adenylate cyclase
MVITTEADNYIVVFPSAKDAVHAAVDMRATVDQYNKKLPDGKKHFEITLNGIGIDFGPGPIQDKHDKLFGPTVCNAYCLGEDMCESGQILLTGSVKKALCEANDPFFSEAKYIDHSEFHDSDVYKNANGVFVLNKGTSMRVEVEEELTAAAYDDAQHLNRELLVLTSRHNLSLTETDVAALDKSICDKYLVWRSVLMIAFEQTESEEPSAKLARQFETMAEIRKILDKYSAEEIEEELFVFTSPVSAVRAAIDIQSVMTRRTSQGNTHTFAAIRGYGIHEGNMLLVPGTDVHWGDPVNTASKLGQDGASDGQLIISDAIYEHVKDDEATKNFNMELKPLTKSKITFNCYNVTQKDAQEDDQVF